MKKTRFVSLALTVLTAISLFAVTAFSAFADDATDVTNVTEAKITISNTNDSHSYNAYQILDGDVTSDGTFSNVVWGSGVDESKIVYSEIKTALGTESDLTSAADVAAALSTYKDTKDESHVVAFATLMNSYLADKATVGPNAVSDGENSVDITITDPGYYLVQDAAAVSDDDALTRNILSITSGTVTINVKSSTPTVEKKVLDDETSEATYNDVADYNIGDAVPFKLTGTMPSTLADYTTYSYSFNDTLSKGFNDPTGVVVTLYSSKSDAEAGTDGTVVTSEFTTSTITTDKTSGAKSFTVSCSDVKSISGVTADSVFVVTYTAALNSDAVLTSDGNPNEVDLTYSNNPNGAGTGTTPKDQVVVFTYTLDITKVDGTDNTKGLKDAEFVLQDASTNKYLTIDVNNKVSGWVDNEEYASVLKSDEDGNFKIYGLDEGKYSLTETKAPTGYNLLANPISLVITAADVHNVDYTGSNAADLIPSEGTTITLDNTSGTVTISDLEFSGTVANNKGSSLPSTGGIGTTIFIVVGGVIVAAAVIILITRKRVKDAQ